MLLLLMQPRGRGANRTAQIGVGTNVFKPQTIIWVVGHQPSTRIDADFGDDASEPRWPFYKFLSSCQSGAAGKSGVDI
jgi:hypothetical protein